MAEVDSKPTKEAKKDIWFPAKKFGYGWSFPITWQGWAVFSSVLVIGLAPLIYLGTFYKGDTYCQSILDQGIKVSCDPYVDVGVYVIGALLWLAAWIMILYHISTKKGEPAKWRWGKKTKHAAKP